MKSTCMKCPWGARSLGVNVVGEGLLRCLLSSPIVRGKASCSAFISKFVMIVCDDRSMAMRSLCLSDSRWMVR